MKYNRINMDYWKGKRVEIPAYTDRWMMGDRYGEVVNVLSAGDMLKVKLDKSGKSKLFYTMECEVIA
ncbi:hypothetical protein OAA60_00890 [Porticoccaceae bacterium]|nr:hypothetical protein [Porticoccaceae bacterium]